MRKIVSLMGVVLLLAACAGAQVSAPIKPSQKFDVHSIAIAPSGGLLADAVSTELFNRGFNVVDPTEVTNLMARLDMSEIEISAPKNLKKLKEQGIDAYLTVKSSGVDGMRPEAASARINETATGKVVAAVSWQNGWGGQAGSMADRVMRSGLQEAAKQIADSLAESLNPI